jgi:hypothetical protein
VVTCDAVTVQAASTPCDNCGAPVSFVLGAAELRCERCGARRALEAGLADTLAAAAANQAAAVAAELRARCSVASLAASDPLEWRGHSPRAATHRS